ncbi:MAG: response regulator [Candidatus Magnetoovum sp. WYHC-5]|nr:response regulator [Candidatus Magnetoovum sp. WYHC-5]
MIRALVVDDDSLSRTILLRFLAPYGQCDTAVNGKEAIDSYFQAFAANKPYSLITLDVMMPEMDGLRVLKNIRRMEKERNITEPNKVKIIITSALSTPQSIIQMFYRAGCNEYITKPVSVQLFNSLLEKYSLIETKGDSPYDTTRTDNAAVH